jgi:hypothetical protein
MRTVRFRVAGILLGFAWAGIATALSPPLDSSLDFFAGEWAGTGAQGSYCYLDLRADGWGWLLVDGGGGDWLGARIQWHNRQQSLQVDKIAQIQNSIELRVMQLKQFVLVSEFNQSLRLTWKESPAGCELQLVAPTAAHLSRARETVKSLRPAKSVP